jgi:1,4-alpha-glucan branching enzyme
MDCDPAGFSWIDCCDADNSVLSFLRHDRSGEQHIAVVCNLTPVPRYHYQIGVPHGGYWRELLNSDAAMYGGSNLGNGGGVDAQPIETYGQPWTLDLTLPPLSVLFLRG